MKKIKKVLGTTALCTALLGVGTGCSLNFDPTTGSSSSEDQVVVCTQTDLDTLNQRLTEKQAELDAVNSLLTEAENNVNAKMHDIEELTAERDELLAEIDRLEILLDAAVEDYNRINTELQSLKAESPYKWQDYGLETLWHYKLSNQIYDDVKLNGDINYNMSIESSDGRYYVSFVPRIFLSSVGEVGYATSFSKTYYLGDMQTDVWFENELGDNILREDSFDIWMQVDSENDDYYELNSYMIHSIRSKNVFDENMNQVDFYCDVYNGVGTNLDDLLPHSGEYTMFLQLDFQIFFYTSSGELQSVWQSTNAEVDFTYQRGE